MHHQSLRKIYTIDDGTGVIDVSWWADGPNAVMQAERWRQIRSGVRVQCVIIIKAKGGGGRRARGA